MTDNLRLEKEKVPMTAVKFWQKIKSLDGKRALLAKGLALGLALSLTPDLRSANAQSTSEEKPSSAHRHATNDYLVKLAPGAFNYMSLFSPSSNSAKVEMLTQEWARVRLPAQGSTMQVQALLANPAVLTVQPNYPVHLIENYQIQDPLRRAAMQKFLISEARKRNPVPKKDNPELTSPPIHQEGLDPDFQFQWGMKDIGAESAWSKTRGSSEMIVAVIDTGVDYTHEDLVPNLWHNAGELGTDENGQDKSKNGIDDDKNGYIDDVLGWDFASKDNKPYDLSAEPLELLTKGGNPGHGTHCAGNVAARGNNSQGVSGVAPEIKIMSIRFISEKGSGTTADAIAAIKYAVDNGARILSNSWGSEGENPAEGESNQALRDAVQYAQDHGVLFVAAAGNGHYGKGYNNDTDKAPAFPASYEHENIISVAAIDKSDRLGSFSNWGLRSVDIAAPGVKVYSTMVGNNYSDMVLDSAGIQIAWDGTSMATPHVAGAAALYWSAHPEKSWLEVKNAILGSAKKVPALETKILSGGKLNVEALLNF